MKGDDAYNAAYFKKFGVFPMDETFRRLPLGMLGGYKFLIKEKVLIEPSFFLDIDLLRLSDQQLSIGGNVLLKLGYRIN